MLETWVLVIRDLRLRGRRTQRKQPNPRLAGGRLPGAGARGAGAAHDRLLLPHRRKRSWLELGEAAGLKSAGLRQLRTMQLAAVARAEAGLKVVLWLLTMAIAWAC